jgi:hypothetical protein
VTRIWAGVDQILRISPKGNRDRAKSGRREGAHERRDVCAHVLALSMKVGLSGTLARNGARFAPVMQSWMALMSALFIVVLEGPLKARYEDDEDTARVLPLGAEFAGIRPESSRAAADPRAVLGGTEPAPPGTNHNRRPN